MRRLTLLMAALALCTPLLARADDSSAGSKDAPKTEVRKKKAAVIQGDTVDVTGKREMPVQMVLTRDPSAKHAFDDSIDEHVRDAAQGH